jgi:hypothetical protein
MPSSSGVPGPAIKSFLAGAGTLDRLEIKNIGLEKQFLAAEKFWNPKLPKLFPQFPQPELLEHKMN